MKEVHLRIQVKSIIGFMVGAAVTAAILWLI